MEDVSEDAIVDGVLFIVELLELGGIAIEELQGATQVFCEGRWREDLAGESLFESIHHLGSLSDGLWLVENGLLSGLKGTERDVVLRFGRFYEQLEHELGHLARLAVIGGVII